MQKAIRGVFLAMSLLPLSLAAQDFDYTNVSVYSVSFSGPDLNIRKDDGSGSYTAPQWVAGAADQSPVAYASGDAPRAAAVLQITCANVPDSLWVRGTGPDSIEFSAKKVPVSTSATTTHNINYPATDGSTAFTADVVRFYNPFVITWEFSHDGTKWFGAGTTENTLYVTRGTPMSETTNFKWWHTVFDLSCRNAEYETTDTGIISHVWNEFLDHVVLNHAGDSLHYYKIMNSPNVTLSSLLKYRDAECYTFAQLFLAAIKIQGVVRSNNYVYITPTSTVFACGYNVNRFLVKNWNFGTPSASGTCADFPYRNTYTTLIPPPYTSYGFLTSDVTDQSGIPGSCTSNPSSYFNNHQITYLDGVYYDPCYGVTFPSVSDIPSMAFDGWSFRYTSSGTTNAFFTNNISYTYLSATVTTW